MSAIYFFLCRTLGLLLRSAKYSRPRIVFEDGIRQVRKCRRSYAPLLIWFGGPLMRLLNTGVRVLPRRDWEERERRIYQSAYGASIRIDGDGTLVLPYLAGETLATLLESPKQEEPARRRAIALAVIALAEFHRRGFTHGDAMAENVMVDLAPRRGSGRPEPSSKGEEGAARWFDFETIHESSRPVAWRRADDVRALLVTCLVRTVPARRAHTLELVLHAYADEGVTRILAGSFSRVLRRPLTFHLAQAGLSLRDYQEIALLLSRSAGL